MRTILSNKKARSDCILAVIYNGDTYGIRTHEPGVRGRCLNRLTKVPIGDAYGIRTREPGVRGQCLNRLTNEPSVCNKG